MTYEKTQVIISLMNELDYAIAAVGCLSDEKEEHLTAFVSKAKTLNVNAYVQCYMPATGTVSYWNPKGFGSKKFIIKNVCN